MSNKRKKGILIGAIVVIIIALLILVFLGVKSRGSAVGPISTDAPIGDFFVSGEQQSKPVGESVEDEIPSITFAGTSRYTVSADSPAIELKNPEGNFVDMVFTVEDKATGELIARTGKVPSGNFVYVDVMDFYNKTPGTYNITVSISTYDSESGAQMNGMNQEAEITVG